MLKLDEELLKNKLKHIEYLLVDFEALRECVKDLLDGLNKNYPFDELEVLYNEMIETIKDLNFDSDLFGWIFWTQTKFKDRSKK